MAGFFKLRTIFVQIMVSPPLSVAHASILKLLTAFSEIQSRSLRQDYHPRELVDPTATLPGPEADEVEEEVLPVGAFRYIFKRPLE